MTYENPPVPWRELERALSGKPQPVGDGNDSPAWSRRRDGYTPPPGVASYADRLADPDRVPYAELHWSYCQDLWIKIVKRLTTGTGPQAVRRVCR